MTDIAIPEPECICDPKIGGFVYNCPVHAKHVRMHDGEKIVPAHEATAAGRRPQVIAPRLSEKQAAELADVLKGNRP